MEEDKIMRNPILSFVEQLQNQIQLCREALSDKYIPLTKKVETLEALLWAKLCKDEEYKHRIREINKDFKEKTKDLKDLGRYGNDTPKFWHYQRKRATDIFKEIMIFIDKKDLMPLGEN